MNYRHHYHAGNFADALKHVFLVALVRALQEKPRGLLLLDTHAGRGEYDLAAAAAGASLPRAPEHPGGIGRLAQAAAAAAPALPPALREYLDLVRGFSPALDRYPGSPRLLERLARPQDRLVFCELHPEEFEALRIGMGRRPHMAVQPLDGYTALRSVLPPPERRGLILIDPPFEALDEWSRALAAMAEALARFPSGTYVLWHPVTARAGAEGFWDDVAASGWPPTWAGRVIVRPGSEGMRGCGLIVVNPPWRFAPQAEDLLAVLGRVLAPEGGGQPASRWLRPET